MAKESVVKASELMDLLAKQKYRCAYTGRELTPQTASCDHFVPVCLGGDHRIGNLRIVHIQANLAKGTMAHEEFVQLCRDVAEHEDKAGKKRVA